jgi:sulfur-oxidizing protein SoxY
MGITPRLTASLLALLAAAPLARAADDMATRQARWRDIAGAIFPGKTLADGASVLAIQAPERALDASLVPVEITVQPSAAPKTLWLVVDDNPAPVAAIMHFGALSDPHVLNLRIRVDQYTLLHAVAELPDGRLVQTARFIKAAGGCSAPGTTDPAEAMARIGRMKLRPVQSAQQSPPAADFKTAELLISHPNYNGMQMDQVTRLYRPARYIRTVTVTEAGQPVFTLDADISLSQDPAITFTYRPLPGKPLDVLVQDSTNTRFHQSFPNDPGRS